MTRVPRGLVAILARRVGGAVLTAQAGGVLMLVIATLAEHGGVDLWTELRHRVPPAASLAAAALVLLGASLACVRATADGTVRALAACGVSGRAFVWAAACAGLPIGLWARWAAANEAPVALPGHPVRGVGGWWMDGMALPDVAGGHVGPPPQPEAAAWGWAGTPVAAGILGAVIGLRGGRGVSVAAAACVVVVEALSRGLVERGSWPSAASWGPAAGCLLVALTVRGRPFPGSRAPARGTPPTPAS